MSQVTATTPTGAEQRNITLSAKAAVITLPLGVLKARAAALFTPPLPADKQRAIAALGMGLLNKVCWVWVLGGAGLIAITCPSGAPWCIHLCSPACVLEQHIVHNH
jgi:hypothetical protein